MLHPFERENSISNLIDCLDCDYDCNYNHKNEPWQNEERNTCVALFYNNSTFYVAIAI